jgi:hypothetical protein
MQPTTRVHDGIPKAILQEADVIFHDSVAFHSTNGVFKTDSDGGNATIGRFLRRGEFPSRGCFLGLDDRDAGQKNPLEAFRLIQATAGWQGVACQLRQALIRGFPVTGVAQEAQVTGLMNHEEVVERMAFLLPTVILLWLLRIFRTLERSFGPIMNKRAAGAAASLGGVSIVATSAAVRAGRNSWSAKARFNTGGSR